MIVEGIVTTLGPDGDLNVAPMGPKVEPGLARFVLRPFRTSTTYRNLKAHGEGVFHTTDDVLLFARSVLGKVVDVPTAPAENVRGRVLVDACRSEEFRVIAVEDEGDRATFHAESVRSARRRDFVGFNRAKNVVIETAILASRADFLPVSELFGPLDGYRVVVGKTGGAEESEAFAMLEAHIRAAVATRVEAGS